MIVAATRASVALGLVLAAVAWAVVCLALVARLARSRPEPLAEDAACRWRGRPVVAGLVVAIAHLVPLAAAVGASTLLSGRMPPPSGLAATVGAWTLVLAVSTAVLLLVDRLARRLLPLAALFRLSLLFPDRAPTRLAVARHAEA